MSQIDGDGGYADITMHMFLPRCALKTSANDCLIRQSHMQDMVINHFGNFAYF